MCSLDGVAMTKSKSNFRVAEGFFSGAAKIVQILEAKDQALKAAELAKLLGVTRQHIYKLAAEGTIPSFQVGAAVRFDPEQIAEWLRRKIPQPARVADQPRIAV
jgi:excisionase family DNA binding protein